MEKIYRVQMNAKGMPNFSTAVEVADRPQGEWNPYYTEREYNDIFNCKLCSHTFIVVQGKENMNYCPNCGNRMKGADDE